MNYYINNINYKKNKNIYNKIIIFSILIIILNLSDSSLSESGCIIMSKSFKLLLNAWPKSLGSGYNTKPESLGSGHRTRELWVLTPDLRATGSDAEPKSPGPGETAKPKGLGFAPLPHPSNLDQAPLCNPKLLGSGKEYHTQVNNNNNYYYYYFYTLNQIYVFFVL
jgi:hypothetical protein